MTITSVDELEEARAVLVSRPAAELADFILSLAFASDGISEYIHAFVFSTDGKAVVDVLSGELEFLRNGERVSDYRYQKGAKHVARADRWLDAVDRCVLQSAPQAALQLLTAFMESYEQISDSCWDDDFGSSQLFNRARTMIEKLAATLPAEDLGAALERLRDEFVVPVARRDDADEEANQAVQSIRSPYSGQARTRQDLSALSGGAGR